MGLSLIHIYKERFYFCANVEEDENEFVTGAMTNENLLNARNAYRIKMGLLTSCLLYTSTTGRQDIGCWLSLTKKSGRKSGTSLLKCINIIINNTHQK